MKIKVGVIFGGETVEHEVSIITAVQAMSYIDTDKYDIVPIYISKDRTWYTGKMLMDMDIYKDFDTLKKFAKKVVLLKKEEGFFLQSTKGLFNKKVEEIDIAFPIVHGKGVEDGSIAGYLESVGIPYVGCSMLGASLGQDKVIMKQVMGAYDLPFPKYTWFYETEYLENDTEILKNIKKIGYPVIIKPAKLGSSIGISIAKTEKDINKCIEEAIKYDNKIIVEEVIDNLLEVNCSVLGNYESCDVSATAEMLTKNDFLTYEDKYIGGAKGKMKGVKTPGKMNIGEMIIPARISKEITDEINKLAITTFNALNLSGVVRIDFLINRKTNKVYVNEPNTIPGCLSFYMWNAVGKDYKKLLDEMISLGIRDYKNNSKKVTSFSSNILSTFTGGAKGLKGMKTIKK